MNNLTTTETSINELKREFSWNENELKEFREIVINDKQLKSRTDHMFLLSFQLNSSRFNHIFFCLMNLWFNVANFYVI